MNPGRLSLWTGLPCAGGTHVCEIDDVVDGAVTRSKDGRHTFSLLVPTDSDCAEQVQRLYCIVTELPNGLVYDWLVSHIERELGSAHVSIVADPPEVVLRDCGAIYTLTAGSPPNYRTVWSGTLTVALTDVVIPFLHGIRGMTWITVGDIESEQELNGQGDAITPGEVIGAYEASPDSGGTGGILDFRRIGIIGYEICLLMSLGAELPMARIIEGMNLLKLQSKESREGIGTSVSVRGAEVEGVRALAGDGAWEVVAKGTPELVSF